MRNNEIKRETVRAVIAPHKPRSAAGALARVCHTAYAVPRFFRRFSRVRSVAFGPLRLARPRALGESRFACLHLGVKSVSARPRGCALLRAALGAVLAVAST